MEVILSDILTAEPFGVRIADVELNTQVTLHFLPTGQFDVTFVEKPPTGGWDPGVTLLARRVSDGQLVDVRFNRAGFADQVQDHSEN